MAKHNNPVIIRECTSIDELARCVQLQREVFALPEIEISPVRHLVVTKHAGGFTLGAFIGDDLVGFVLSVPAYLRGNRAFYSHMTAVRAGHQSFGIGAQLKWAQRERSLAEGVKFIKWTFEPLKARNAYFNLEKLGAVVREYTEDYYGVDYDTAPEMGEEVGLASDRLFGEWELESDKVCALASGEKYDEKRAAVATIVIPADWSEFVSADVEGALNEQMRVRSEFQTAFGQGMVCRGFRRDDSHPRFLLFED
jgi:predicted GNAT superfamily acetyltransferase